MLGDRIKDLRKKNKITQSDLSSIIGYSQSLIANWERDERDPDTETLVKLADYFNVSTDYLLGREDYYGNPYKSEKKENRPVQARPKKSDIELIYESLNPRQQESLMIYAQGMLAGIGKTLEDLKIN